MAIIKIEPNKPLTLSLKYSSAIEKQGKWGLQYLYTLSEPDGVIYLPPIAHDEIQKLHAGPGEPFTLTKSIGQGNAAVWKVERVALPSAPVESELPKHPAAPSSSENYIAPKSITNGRVAVMPAPGADLSTRQSSAIVRQLIAAVDACKVTQQYAKSQGIEFQPTSDIICRLAITGGIQSFKEGVY